MTMEKIPSSVQHEKVKKEKKKRWVFLGFIFFLNMMTLRFSGNSLSKDFL